MELHQLMQHGEVITSMRTDNPSERVRRLREERGIGMMEAKKIVMREELVADISAAATIDDIKALLLRII